MSIKFNRNIFDNFVPPEYILTKANNDRLYVLNCTEKKYSFKFNTPDIIQFKTYMMLDNMKNPAYDSIVEGQFIEVEGFGRFIISSVDIESQSQDFECKDCEAVSTETMLGQKYLELFTVNMGTVESIDGVRFYNLSNPDKSLLHLVLEKCPDWTLGHVDTSLITMERCFEITRQDVYSFLTQDVAAAFQCVFLFDSLHQKINVYSEENVGHDTDIFVTYNNLLKSTNISSSINDIKTCLTVKGADDLNLREVNMGYDKIYMLNFFHSLEFMSKGLYSAYDKWVKKWNTNISNYSSLLSQYQKYYNQINNLTNEKMPSNAESTNWSEYGLIPLQEKLAAYEKKQAVMIKAGQGNKNHKDYKSMYLPVYNTINSIKSQIAVVKNQIESLRSKQSAIGIQMGDIITSIDMKNNFTSDQLNELSKFVREDELSTSNFVVTDNMTDSERMDMLKEMLEFGQKELRKVSQPQLQFSAEMLNLFEIDEFKDCSSNFEPGNYINIILRDDYIIKARLLTIDIDFYNPEDFTVTFGNMNKVKGKNIYTDTTKAIDTATSVATTVSFNSSNWNRANKNADDINKVLSDGLIGAGKYLRNGDDSELVIDTRGIFINTTSGQYAGKDSIFEGGGRILFTDNNWETVSMSVGRADVTIKGKTESRFGTFADFLIAGFVGGSTIEGTEIYGGFLQSLNYSAGKTGTKIDLNKGTFEFNANNESKLTLDENGLLTAKGTIKAEKGWIGGQNAFIVEDGKIYCKKKTLTSNSDGVYIGTDGIALGANNVFKVTSDGTFYAEKGYIGGANGFTLEKKKLYNGKSSISDTANGIYIGTDGIALGANNVLKLTSDGTFYAEKGYLGGTNGFVLEKNKIYNGKSSISDATNGIYLGTDGIALGTSETFKVTPQGHATVKSGTIGGATIQNNAIHASNNNWWIGADGSASFKNVFITGVKNDSQFGSVGYKDGITWGDFSGNSYFGSNVTNPFSGTCITHIEELAVSQITADRIRAKAIEAGFIDADTINSMYIDTNELKAERANIDQMVVDSIDANNVVISKLVVDSIDANNVVIDNLYVKSANIDDIIANNATVNNLKTSSINANRLTAGTVNGYSIDWRKVSVVQGISFSQSNVVTSVNFDTKSVGKTSVLSGYSVTSRDIYVLCHIT